MASHRYRPLSSFKSDSNELNDFRLKSKERTFGGNSYDSHSTRNRDEFRERRDSAGVLPCLLRNVKLSLSNKGSNDEPTLRKFGLLKGIGAKDFHFSVFGPILSRWLFLAFDTPNSIHTNLSFFSF
jgi:hypothetical protein